MSFGVAITAVGSGAKSVDAGALSKLGDVIAGVIAGVFFSRRWKLGGNGSE